MSKESSKRPTVRDVARVAGVSTATVSRALQSPEIVSKKTRDVVFRAVAQTGYSINTAAQMLRRNRSGTVLVILPDISNPFFSKLLSGIEEVATKAGLTILIGNTNGDQDRYAKILENLRNGRADAALLLNGAAPPDGIVPNGVPIVSISERIIDSELAHVGTDNVRAAFDATRYLQSLGHRNIAHLTGPVGNQLTQDRLAGYLDAMRSNGFAQSATEVQGGFTYEEGKRAAGRLLEFYPDATAVFCANDESAMGLIRGLEALGIDVPDQVSVMGFDDIPFAAVFKPELTTVHQARNKIGIQAMETLLAMMQGEALSPEAIFLPHEVVPRDSTKLVTSRA